MSDQVPLDLADGPPEFAGGPPEFADGPPEFAGGPPEFAGGPPEFTDGKEAGALRTIGEIAQAFGIKQHVLRYWEEQFPMLRPLKRAGGRRYYRPEDVKLIGEINRLLYAEGFTIRGARQALGGKGALASSSIATSGRADAKPPQPDLATSETSPNGIVARLRAVRDGLSQALKQG